MILDGRNETGHPRKIWDALLIRGRLLREATVRLRNPKRAEASGGNEFVLSGFSVPKLHVDRMR
jgi:hypothetical protein